MLEWCLFILLLVTGCCRFKQRVTLIAQFLHMHGLGKNMTTSRVRNGQELQPLATLRAFEYGEHDS